MTYTQLMLIFSLFSLSLCSKSHPSEDNLSPAQEDDLDQDDGKEDLILASFLYEKFKYTFDLANNQPYLQDVGEKPLTFNFLEIDEDEDWKVVAKLKGAFTYANGSVLEVDEQLLKYGVIGPDEEITDDNKDEVIQLSTMEVSSVKSPYRVLITCQDCQEVLEAIGEANDGLHITEDVMTFDTIGQTVADNGDGSFTLSMVVLLYNDMDYSEMTSIYNDEEEEMNSSMVSGEIDRDIDISLKQFIGSKFNQNLEAAQMIQEAHNEAQNSSLKKFLV